MSSHATVLGPVASVRALAALTRGDRVEHLTRLASSYRNGCVLNLPTQQVLITSAQDTAKQVLIERSDRYIKGMGQLHAREIIGDGLLTAEGRTWSAQRRSAQPYLRSRTVQKRLPQIVSAAQASAVALGRARWEEVDLTVPLANYTLACLAHTFDFAPPEGRRVHEAFDTIQNEAILRAVTQGLLPLWVRPRQAKRVRQALAELREQARGALGPDGRSDDWSSTEGMMSLFLAGYETTASTLSWAATFVAHDPALQRRLAEEGALLTNADTVAVSSLGSLPWAAAVFQETLRLRPPVWLLSRRLVVADLVAGVALRPGDEVLLLPGGTSPDRSFEPSRAVAGEAPQAPLAFGAGLRSCPGVTLAGMEAMVWLAVVLHELELAPLGASSAPPLARMSQAPRGGARVRIRSR